MKSFYKFLIVFLLFLVGTFFLGRPVFASTLTIYPLYPLAPIPPYLSLVPGETLNTSVGWADTNVTLPSVWMVNVDYGDGSGIQSFPWYNQNSIPINHTYQTQGTYILTFTITDNIGKTATSTTTINVSSNNTPFTVTALQVPGVGSDGSGSPLPTEINFTYYATQSFYDPRGPSEAHTATINWGDGNSGTVNLVNIYGNTGLIYETHRYTLPGLYTLTITITDKEGVSITTSLQYVVIYDPSAGFVTGGGTITSPLGAYTQDSSLSGKAIFGFVSKYQNGVNIPTGETQFRFQVANFTFKSTSYDWLVIGGAKAQYKGSGMINGSGDFGFILTAIDGEIPGGGGTDKFRIKITDKTTGNVIYDNQMGLPDTSNPTATIDSGSIIIHSQ